VSVVTTFTAVSNLNYATFTSYFSAMSNSGSNPIGISFRAGPSPSTLDGVEVMLSIQPNNLLYYFGGIIIVFDVVNIGISGAQYVADLNIIKTTTPFDIAIPYSAWGPWFNTKCIFGFNIFDYVPG
jgi:hypothetical protein